MRKITVTVDQEIGSGYYSRVYRISETLVVKAFKMIDIAELLVADEIYGSTLYKNALPVLEKVIVVLPDGQETFGLVKTYIPFELTIEEILTAIDEGLIEKFWDTSTNNFRKDEDGKIWQIDSQVEPFDFL